MNLLKTCLFILSATALMAEQVNVTSDSMTGENLKKEIHFIGNAKVVQGKSWILADELIVYFDDNNDTKSYEALGLSKKVTFEIERIKSSYVGNADKVIFYPVEEKYVLIGRAIVNDRKNKRHLSGEKIVLNTVTGNANVKSSKKKPVKFIFNTKAKN